MLNPLEDNIILERVEETNNIGLVLLENKSNKARVVAVGQWKLLEDWTRQTIPLSVWDIVYFNKHLIEELGDKLVIKYSGIYAVESL